MTDIQQKYLAAYEDILPPEALRQAAAETDEFAADMAGLARHKLTPPGRGAA